MLFDDKKKINLRILKVTKKNKIKFLDFSSHIYYDIYLFISYLKIMRILHFKNLFKIKNNKKKKKI